MKALVVYYSRTGLTKTLAEHVAGQIGADVEAIVDSENRKGPFGFIKAAFDALKGKCPKIGEIKSKVEDYDVVVVATPVWAGKTSTPVNTFLRDYGDRIKNYAVILTRGDAKNDYKSVTEIFEGKLKKSPVAFLSMPSESVKNKDFKAADSFSAAINQVKE